jgi:hypothetical protein
MEHYDVLIATPGTDLKAAYVDSLVKTLAECDKRGLTYKWLNGQSSLVHHAREITMSGDMRLDPDDKGPMHGQVTYNKIVWIDSDIEWQVEDFFRLYDSEYEIVSGAYLLSDNTTTTIHTQEYLQGIPKHVILGMTDPIKVQSIGFGFVAIKSGVFERLERPWFAHFSQYIINSRGEKLPDSLGEDISWCVRAYNAQIPVMFDPKVLVNHMKVGKITWK